jgi:hypothetical protein
MNKEEIIEELKNSDKVRKLYEHDMLMGFKKSGDYFEVDDYAVFLLFNYDEDNLGRVDVFFDDGSSPDYFYLPKEGSNEDFEVEDFIHFEDPNQKGVVYTYTVVNVESKNSKNLKGVLDFQQLCEKINRSEKYQIDEILDYLNETKEHYENHQLVFAVEMCNEKLEK